MLIFTKIRDLKAFINAQKAKGKVIGFIPTMGALHKGHISLIEASKGTCDVTVASIFVNPTQFNDKKDLDRYPRTPQKDANMLKEAGCDALFMPEVAEMYPLKDERAFDFGTLDKVLDGAHRPGHFNGVAQIVSKLFDAVEPHKAFFGNKDLQQVLIIKALVKKLRFEIEIVACPILREEDGLAMSSRNTLLSQEKRKAANIIPQLMFETKELKAEGKSVGEIKNYVQLELSKDKIYKLDYFEICDGDNLQSLTSFSQSKVPVALIACFVGKIRLIDNLNLSE
jgi:pantoate--beta-alanine ligase